jgi:hypothetical protein
MDFHIQVNSEGKLPKKAIADLQECFRSFSKKHITISVDKYKKKSNQQLRYWRGVVVKAFSEYTGYDEDEMHEILKFKCDWWEYKEINGEKYKVTKSITLASTTDFMSIIDKAQRWGSELGFVINDPDPNYKGDFIYLEDELGIKDE